MLVEYRMQNGIQKENPKLLLWVWLFSPHLHFRSQYPQTHGFEAPQPTELPLSCTSGSWKLYFPFSPFALRHDTTSLTRFDSV